MFVFFLVIFHLLNYQVLTVTIDEQDRVKAHLKIKFISFVNPDDTVIDGTPCDVTLGCDTYIQLTVFELLNGGETLLIKSYRSRTWTNKSNVLFTKSLGYKVLNPVILDLPYWSNTNGYLLNISVKDKDIIFHDLIAEWTQPYKSIGGTNFTLSGGNGARLQVEIAGYCSLHYYAEDCRTFCQSEEPFYGCDNGTGMRICKSGYSGSLCHTKQNSCRNSSCSGHGVCLEAFGNFACHCYRGYTGRFCEITIDACQEAQGLCMHGRCVNDTTLENIYRCECDPGYNGVLCDSKTHDCSSFSCQNNGTCLVGIDTANCLCQTGYTGRFCEDRCTLSCIPGQGVCHPVEGRLLTCVCLPGYQGSNCEVDIDECLSSPCKKDECVDMIDGYKCQVDDHCIGNKSLTQKLATEFCLLTLQSPENCEGLVQPDTNNTLNQTCFLLGYFKCGAQKFAAAQCFLNITALGNSTCQWTLDAISCQKEYAEYTQSSSKQVVYCLSPLHLAKSSRSVRIQFVDVLRLKELVARHWYIFPITLAVVVMMILIISKTRKSKQRKKTSNKSGRTIPRDSHPMSALEDQAEHIYEEVNFANSTLESFQAPTPSAGHLTSTAVDGNIYTIPLQRFMTPITDEDAFPELNNNYVSDAQCAELYGISKHVFKDQLNVPAKKIHGDSMHCSFFSQSSMSDPPTSECASPTDPSQSKLSPKLKVKSHCPPFPRTPILLASNTRDSSRTVGKDTSNQPERKRNGFEGSAGKTAVLDSIGQSDDHCSTHEVEPLDGLEVKHNKLRHIKSSSDRRFTRNPLYIDLQANHYLLSYRQTPRLITSKTSASKPEDVIRKSENDGRLSKPTGKKFRRNPLYSAQRRIICAEPDVRARPSGSYGKAPLPNTFEKRNLAVVQPKDNGKRFRQNELYSNPQFCTSTHGEHKPGIDSLPTFI